MFLCIPYNLQIPRKYMNITQTMQMSLWSTNWSPYLDTENAETNCDHDRIRGVGKNGRRWPDSTPLSLCLSLYLLSEHCWTIA